MYNYRGGLFFRLVNLSRSLKLSLSGTIEERLVNRESGILGEGEL